MDETRFAVKSVNIYLFVVVVKFKFIFLKNFQFTIKHTDTSLPTIQIVNSKSEEGLPLGVLIAIIAGGVCCLFLVVVGVVLLLKRELFWFWFEFSFESKILIC